MKNLVCSLLVGGALLGLSLSACSSTSSTSGTEVADAGGGGNDASPPKDAAAPPVDAGPLTHLDRTLSCPKTAPDLQAVYSVASGTLTIYETDPQSKLVAGSVYVKQTSDAAMNGDGGGGCNTVFNAAPEATTSTVKGEAPTATGGTIAEGTYFQTELNVFDPNGTASAPSPSGLRVTLVIKGNVMSSVQELPDGSTATFTETFVVRGN
jgi:hypothetical protein